LVEKNLHCSIEDKRQLISSEDTHLSVRRQYELLAVNRSSLYYTVRGESEYNQLLMNKLDEQYTKTPFYGVLKMTEYLRNLGHEVNVKRVRRLLRNMGLEAIYPKPNLSRTHPEHKIYPYLLRGLKVERKDQVWSTDITYIRLNQGFCYLVAIIDWYSRYVLNWKLSTSLDTDFCIEALAEVLEHSHCEIFNTDQGSQFTSPRFTQPLLDKDIRISMDGRGRALDNIFVERLWRSVKDEKVSLSDLESIKDAQIGLKEYLVFLLQSRTGTPVAGVSNTRQCL
jgi:putative transposase